MDTNKLVGMPMPIQAWHAEHAYFSRLLDLLQRQVDLFHGGQRPGYELMLDIITYLREYSDRFHHPREDVAFECLARRAPDMRLVLARLCQEHRVIALAGEKLARLLDAVLDEALVTRSEVETAAATYLVYYRNHIAREEDGVLERAAELLTAEDWESVRRAVPAEPDSARADPDQRYRELRRHIALEA
jgi:hemerythrin-like domain-containing protein